MQINEWFIRRNNILPSKKRDPSWTSNIISMRKEKKESPIWSAPRYGTRITLYTQGETPTMKLAILRAYTRKTKNFEGEIPIKYQPRTEEQSGTNGEKLH